MAPKKAAKSQETEISEPPPDQSNCDLEDVLLAKAIEQIDVRSLASKLAPELANRLLGRLSIDVLKDRLLDLLVCKIIEDSTLVGAVSMHLLTQLLPESA